MMPETTSRNFTPSRQIAQYLLKIGAVKFNLEKPFKWTSGIESPIYCDNRIINSNVEVRDAVVNRFSSLISENFKDEVDVIAGVATGGVPYGVLAADRLRLPFIYVRDKRKEHGMMNIIEGGFQPGQRAVVIEDHISTGLSSNKAIEALMDAGLKIVALFSIMTYSFKEADALFDSRGIEHASICNLDTVLSVAQENGLLTQSQVNSIIAFRANPTNWQ